MTRFWVPDAPFTRPVCLHMARTESDGDTELPLDMDAWDQRGVVETATWVVRGQAHYVMYDGEWDPRADQPPATDKVAAEVEGAAEEADLSSARTIWKLERDAVTLIRHGWLRWTLRFLPGQTTATTGYLGETPLAISVRTERSVVDVGRAGGRVDLAWMATVAGAMQTVRLRLEFCPTGAFLE